MSKSIDDIELEGNDYADLSELIALDEPKEQPIPENEPEEGMEIDLGIFLKKPVGKIEDYVDHFANVDKTMGLAQMIRGFTTMVGNFEWAITDIVWGWFRWRREKKHAVKAE